MYIKKRINLIELIANNWMSLLLMVFVITVVTVGHINWNPTGIAPPATAVASITTAIAFFIGFFTTQAYGRWWEARIVWGTFVNDSRSFGRMVTNFFAISEHESEVANNRATMIRRHIAFLYAVKERLRLENTKDYVRYLSDADAKRVDGASSVGNTLLEIQGEDISAAEQAGLIDGFKLSLLNDMLSRFSTSMGMAERIKTTVFPPYYAAMIRVSIWVAIVIIPLPLSEEAGYWAILFASLLGMIGLLIFNAAKAMLDPFEGQPGDTPMSSIVRTIEINLLEQLGETATPPAVEPVDGRYLL